MDNNVSRNQSSASDTRADLHSKIDNVVSTAHSGVDKVADKFDDVSETLSAKTDQLSAAYKRFSESGRNYVRQSPAKSVLIALAAGYAVSKLLGSRKH